jgi:hypothetical protein
VGKTRAQHDRVKVFADRGEAAPLLNHAVGQLIAHHNRWHKRKAACLAGKQPKHRHIVDFGEQLWLNASLLEQKVKDGAVRVVPFWPQQRQRLGVGRHNDRCCCDRHVVAANFSLLEGLFRGMQMLFFSKQESPLPGRRKS